MPVFVWIGRDGPDGVEGRKRQREAHLASLGRIADQGRVRFAGPLRDAAGTPRGSVIVFDAADLAEARAVAESDPYTTGGVFGSIEVFESLQVFPRKGG